MSTDDVEIEAALALYGVSITRHDLAAALEWDLARVERALRVLEQRLAGTGLCLRREGWDSYTLAARRNILPWSAREQLGQVRCGHAQLPVWTTALLRCIVNGGATRGLDDFIEEPDRSVGIDLLLNYELIVPTRRGYRASDQVAYSLRLAMWR
jgi:hypothetical protein